MTTQATPDSEVIRIHTDVLVVGGGLTAARAAMAISGLGYPVVVAAGEEALGKGEGLPPSLASLGEAEKDRQLKTLVEAVLENERIEVLTRTTVAGVSGMTGDFSVRLARGTETIDRKVGAVVLATDLEAKPLAEAYGLALAENVISQTGLEALLDAADGPEKLAGQTVACFMGFGQEGDPVAMERLLKSVKALEAIDNVTVYVFVHNLKVAAKGLERLYKEGRDQGAIYIKLTEIPRISRDGTAVTYFDPVIRRDVELCADMIVLEEALCANRQNARLAEVLRIDPGYGGFLQEENVHFLPVRSNREGILVVGAGRGVQTLETSWMDVDNALTELAALLGDGRKARPRGKAVIDREKCAICLTCYRVCPHGAIYWDDKAVVSPVACQGCGNCAAECPMDAIQVEGFEDDTIKSGVREALQRRENPAPQIVAFCCRNSALEAGQMAAAFQYELPAGLRMIEVPCAGKIDLEYLLNAFTEGADGVLVMTCHPGNCKSQRGNTYASWRVEDARRMLEEVGLEKERLEFVTLASNMGRDFARFVVDMQTRISELGKSPVAN